MEQRTYKKRDRNGRVDRGERGERGEKVAGGEK